MIISNQKIGTSSERSRRPENQNKKLKDAKMLS